MSDSVLLKKIEEIIAANNKVNNQVLLTEMDKKIAANNKVLLDAVDKKIEERIDQKFVENNAVLLNAMDKKIQSSEDRIKKEITETLSKKIVASQEDTIEVLTSIINTGYYMHEERITRIENELELPPLKQKH